MFVLVWFYLIVLVCREIDCIFLCNDWVLVDVFRWRCFRYFGVGWLGVYVSVEYVLFYLDFKKGMKIGVILGD